MIVTQLTGIHFWYDFSKRWIIPWILSPATVPLLGRISFTVNSYNTRVRKLTGDLSTFGAISNLVMQISLRRTASVIRPPQEPFVLCSKGTSKDALIGEGWSCLRVIVGRPQHLQSRSSLFLASSTSASTIELSALSQRECSFMESNSDLRCVGSSNPTLRDVLAPEGNAHDVVSREKDVEC